MSIRKVFKEGGWRGGWGCLYSVVLGTQDSVFVVQLFEYERIKSPFFPNKKHLLRRSRKTVNGEMLFNDEKLNSMVVYTSLIRSSDEKKPGMEGQ